MEKYSSYYQPSITDDNTYISNISSNLHTSKLYVQSNGSKYMTNNTLQGRNEDNMDLELHKTHARQLTSHKESIKELKTIFEEEKVKTQSLSEEMEKINFWKEKQRFDMAMVDQRVTKLAEIVDEQQKFIEQLSHKNQKMSKMLSAYFSEELNFEGIGPKIVEEVTKECVICLGVATHIITTCGHMCMCENCGKTVKNCPICRRGYCSDDQFIKVYL